MENTRNTQNRAKKLWDKTKEIRAETLRERAKVDFYRLLCEERARGSIQRNIEEGIKYSFLPHQKRKRQERQKSKQAALKDFITNCKPLKTVCNSLYHILPNYSNYQAWQQETQ